MTDSRKILRDYYDAAASKYLDRASRGVMGWLRRRELALTQGLIPANGNGRRALDAGCGPGYYSQILRERGFDVTPVDISPRMVEMVRKLGFSAYVMDIEHSDPPPELPHPFDFILCAGVLEFANDVRRFLGALKRQAADGAEMVLVAPLAGTLGFLYKTYLEKRGIPAKVYKPEPLTQDLQIVGFQPLETHIVRPICLAVRARATSRNEL